MALFKAFGLGSKDPGMRQQAIEKLAGNPRNVEKLLTYLEDKDANVRDAASVALSKIKLPAGEKNEALFQTLVRLLKTPDVEVRLCAATVLRKLDWRPANDQERVLLEIALGNLRGAAALGAAAVTPLLAELKHPLTFQRRAAAEALEVLSDPQVLWGLLTAARDPDSTVKVSALRSLAGDQSEQVDDLLVQTLWDADSRARLAAAEVLALRDSQFKYRENFIPLLGDKQFEIRLAAVRYLGKSRDPKVIEHMFPLLSDPDADVRRTVIQSLAVLHDPACIEKLLAVVTDEESSVREAVLGALSQIDAKWPASEAAKQAVPRLQNELKNPSPWVRQTAARVLAQITGGHSDDYANAWKATVIPIE